MEILHTALGSLLASMQSGCLNAASRVTGACQGQPRSRRQHKHLPPRLKTAGTRPEVQSQEKQLKVKSTKGNTGLLPPHPQENLDQAQESEEGKGSNHYLTGENKSGVRSKMNPGLENDFLNKTQTALTKHRTKTLIYSLTLKLRPIVHRKHLKERYTTE